MNIKNLVLAVLLALGAPLATADEVVLDAPLTGNTLWFADRYASAFYTVDEQNFEVVVTFAAGSESSSHPVRQVVQLNDGQSFQVSVGGYGPNQLTATLELSRVADRIRANVTTQVAAETLATR